jgi:SdrD B-like domain/Secretion system C-terminal sorting domain
MKNLNKLICLLLCIAFVNTANAQSTGTVFRDFNGNGTKQANEPFVPGVTVNAYNASEVLVGSSITAAGGNWSITPTGGYPVRIEFVLSSAAATNCFFNQGVDFNGYAGSTYGSNVRFLAAQTTGLTYAISYPGEYVTNVNPKIATSVYTNGNLTAGAGNSGNLRNAVTVQYSTVNAVSPTAATNATQVNQHADMGSVWGVTHHVQSGRLFYAAVLKRHTALGPNGSGAVYIVNPATSTGATLLFDLDALGFATRATGAYVYAATTGQAAVNNIPYTGFIGTNAERGIPNSTTAYTSFASPGNAHSYDAASFAQVGKVGLGGIDVSDDGRYVFVMNLFDKKLYRITLVNPATPGTPAVTAADVKAFTLTDPTYAGGTYRPWAVKYYRGKVFVGMTNDLSGTALLAGTTSIANGSESTVPKYANAKGSVYSLDNPTTTGAGAFSLVTDIALNYARLGVAGEIDGFDKLAASAAADGVNENHIYRYNPWTDDYDKFKQDNTAGNMKLCFPQPILSDIEFDMTNNAIAVSVLDRLGLQCSYRTYSPKDNGPDDGPLNSTQAGYGNSELASGDLIKIPFTAVCGTGTILPNNSAANNEFYTGDYYGNGGVITPAFHQEIVSGGITLLPGSNEIMANVYDPSTTSNSGGLKILNNTSGAAGNNGTTQFGANIYDAATRGITPAKGIGLGDIEFIRELPPIEIGNRVWNDANGDGIQNADEAGIGGVALEIFVDNNNDGVPDGAAIGTTTTAAAGDIGSWYFNNANITGDADPNTAGTQTFLTQGVNYIIRPAAAAWAGGVGIGVLANLQLTRKNKIGNGAVDFSDSDAGLTTGANPIPQISYNPSVAGANNHNLDFGFKPQASIGDRIWRDDNKNATQDAGEPGVSGITITLYRPGFGLDGIAATADDALPIGNTVTDSYGNYLFDNLAAGNYQVQVNLPANYQFTTQSNTVDNTDGTVVKALGSDVNATTGLSYTIALTAGENERNIDAGLIFNVPAAVSSIGDRVWYDTNGNGTQDAGEPGTSNVTVTLYKETAPASGVYVVYATTVTDANGNYLFNNLPNNTNYKVGITPPAGTLLTSSTGTTAGNSTTDSDLDPTTRLSAVVNIPAIGAQITGIDVGLILQPTTKASLGDRVWYDNNRDGDQDAGEPGIAGVTVQLMDAYSNVLATTTTDAFGMYIFTNLTPGVYRVNFGAVAGMQRTAKDATGGTIADITDSDADPTTGKTLGYTLNAGGKNMSIDAGYYSTQPAANVGAIGDRVWVDNNGNGVQDAGEPSVAGVTVTLYNNAGTVIATATTDINGFYLFPGLTPGNYTVGFSNLPAGFGFSGQNKGGNTATDGDANTATGRTQTVVVTGGTTNTTVDAGIRLGLPSGLGSLGNKVFYDLPGGVAGQQDAGELGVANVTVQLYLDANGDGSITGAEQTAIATTTTNALGEYLFAGLNAGSYQVGFSNLPGSYTLTVKDAAGISDDEDSDGNAVNTAVNGNPAVAGKSYTDLISLAQGEDNLSVDLGLITPANTNTLGDFVWFDANSNGVQDVAESGVPGVMVTLYNNAGTAIAVTTTDASGQYLFTGLADGNYSVGFINYPSGFDLTTKSAANDLTGSDADRVSGRTATVALNYAAGGTNRDNRSLDAGLITTRAALGDKVFSDLNNNGTQDAGEYGIAGVTVSLFRPGFGLDGIAGNADDALAVASMITDGKGNYFFSNLIPGDYQLEFTTIPTGMLFTQQNTPGDNQNNTNSDAVPANANGRTVTITLSAGETDLTVDAGLTVPRPATIGNFVWDDFNTNGIQDANEAGVGGFLVVLYNSVNQPIGSAVTDGNGYWQITNVPAGTGYYVIFSPNLPAFNTTASPGTNPAWTTQNLGANGASALDSGTESDVDSDVTATGANAGRTAAFNIVAGNNFPNIDAGVINWARGNVLPIQLVSFTAQPQGNNVQLNWVVTTETNVATYQILYSTTGTNFTAIASQPATGSRNYSQLHTAPQQGLNYYRLKVIDIDGAVSYSEIRKVNFGKLDANSITMYPIPANTTLNITFSAGMINKAATISILSVNGQLQLQQTVSAISQTETINVSKLVSGKYIVSITINNETINRQIEVIR